MDVQAIGSVAIKSTVDTHTAASDRGERNDFAINTASRLTAGGDLSVSASNTARVKASTLTATGALSLQATGDVVIESGQDAYDLKLKNYGLNTITQKSAELTAGGDVTLGSLVGDLSIIASKVDSGGAITLNTPGGTLYLGARKDYREEHISDSKSGAFITTYSNRGTIDETVVPTLLTANGNIAIVTGDGVIVDYKDTGSFTDSIDQLSQAPGLAWMADVRTRNDVTWNAVQEAHQSWDYRTQGISPTGAALISLAVSAASGGVGAGLNGWGAQAFGMTSATNASLVAAANAGFTTLVSQAAQALVGNGGDIGATLKQLGSTATLKNLATSMITAGLMEGLPMDKLGLDASKTAPFVEKLKYNIATSSISATVDSVINGTPLTENLKNGLVNAAVTVVGAEAASAIGEAARLGDINTTTQLIAHAALGCAMGAANGDCKAGAIGGATGEIIGGVYSAITAAELNDDIQEIWNMHDLPESARELRIVEIQYEWRARGVDVAKISAAIVAAVTGVNVDTAVTTSGNAAENNALFLIPIAAAALYTMYVGEGDFREGLREIGRGNDPLSETIADGVTKTVELSAKHYPDETKAVLQVVADLDGAVDATIQYIDKKTGKVVSTTWNTIDQNTRDEIKGGVAVLSVIIPADLLPELSSFIS